MTVSAGVAVCAPSTVAPCLVDELYTRADRQLYRAKAQGRDRVCVERTDERTDEPAGRSIPATAQSSEG